MRRLFSIILTLMVILPAYCQYSDCRHCCKDQLWGCTCYQELAVLVVRDGKEALEIYSGFRTTAPNGEMYQRWYTWQTIVGKSGGRPFSPWGTDTYLGYRFADGKMYVYDFAADKEIVGLDFTLLPGDKFTTPDGTEWEVTATEKREFKTLYGKTSLIDYLAEHTVLSVRSTDGTKTDEWIEYVDAVKYPIVLQDKEKTQYSHLCYKQFDDEWPYLVLEFDDDPLYCRYLSYAERNPEKQEENHTMEINGNEMTFDFHNFRSYQVRFIYYAYRAPESFNIYVYDLGPRPIGGGAGTSGQLTFPVNTDNPEALNVTFNGNSVPTSIKEINADQLPSLNTTKRYNLQGQEVGEGYKGIVIKNRRKEVQR